MLKVYEEQGKDERGIENKVGFFVKGSEKLHACGYQMRI